MLEFIGVDGRFHRLGKEEKMTDHQRKYILAGLLGATIGGLFVALATNAVPKMMSKMMSGMMGNMMAQMEAAGCDPSEM
jgi:CheY-specific phosphatase CheX